MKASYFAHDSAVIEDGCNIGEGTKIWHFSHVMSGSRIGTNCNIGQNVVILSGVEIGNGVKIQNNVSVYTGVICEDDVFVGPSVVFTNVINPRSAVVRKHEFKQTLVRKGATLGANSTIICGCEIGAFAFIGAGSVITKSVLSYALVVGNPGRQTGWMSEFGHRLHFNKDGFAQCPESGQTYRLNNQKVERES